MCFAPLAPGPHEQTRRDPVEAVGMEVVETAVGVTVEVPWEVLVGRAALSALEECLAEI